MNFNTATNDQVLFEITKRVKQRRLNLNITQQALANSAGLHVQTIKNFESGKSAKLITFIQILRVFDDLDSLNLLLPEPGISPIEMLKLRGKERERASGKSSDQQAESTW